MWQQTRRCVVCESEYVPISENHRYCSKRCKNRAENAIKGGIYRGARAGEKIGWRDVWVRDGGKCRLCGEPIDISLRHPDPKSASLDHIVPISAGGAHCMTNVQLAHLGCNSKKGGLRRKHEAGSKANPN